MTEHILTDRRRKELSALQLTEPGRVRAALSLRGLTGTKRKVTFRQALKCFTSQLPHAIDLNPRITLFADENIQIMNGGPASGNLWMAVDVERGMRTRPEKLYKLLEVRQAAIDATPEA